MAQSLTAMRLSLVLCLLTCVGIAYGAATASHGAIYITHKGASVPVGEQVQLDVHVKDSTGMPALWRGMVAHSSSTASSRLHVYAVHQVCSLRSTLSLRLTAGFEVDHAI